MERSLIPQYRDMIVAATRVLRPENYRTVVALAELPDGVRGYEDVKVETIRTYLAAVGDLKRELGLLPKSPASPPTPISKAA